MQERCSHGFIEKFGGTGQGAKFFASQAGGRLMLKASIFDCDGVLVDTERDAHRVGFNRAFAEHSGSMPNGVSSFTVGCC